LRKLAARLSKAEVFSAGLGSAGSTAGKDARRYGVPGRPAHRIF